MTASLFAQKNFFLFFVIRKKEKCFITRLTEDFITTFFLFLSHKKEHNGIVKIKIIPMKKNGTINTRGTKLKFHAN